MKLNGGRYATVLKTDSELNATAADDTVSWHWQVIAYVTAATQIGNVRLLTVVQKTCCGNRAVVGLVSTISTTRLTA